jgi:uncharacterized protein YxjI
MNMRLKALVIRDDEGKFTDVGDVVQIARAEGKKIFKTQEKVLVMRLFFERDIGWIAVVGCSGSQVECEASKRTE